MSSELPGLLSLWLNTEFPHFYFDSYSANGPWYGWIKCRCEFKRSASTARIEADKICLISASPKYYTTKHEENCPDRATRAWCYCGEKIITIYDVKGFANLKTLLAKAHDRLVRNKEDRLLP